MNKISVTKAKFQRRLQMEKNRRVQCLTGTRDFINELRGRTFKSAEGILNKVTSQDLSYDFVVENGFKNPIFIEKPDGLELATPKINDWTELEQYIDGDRTIEVIDVESQNYLLTSFSYMLRYMNKQSRTKLINLISLECSDTRLGKFIKPPSIALELDWVTKYWTTKKAKNDTSNGDRPPQVQKYCLISPIDAYTDFHIDFGGTSVWYHVVKGAKTFYLIRPTADNMELYTNWIESSNRLRTFFADQVDDCYKLTLHPGNTLLLPTGWIHAVLTIEDSLVFGGNFLHSLNIEGQLAIYDLEKKSQTPSRLMYPQFEEVNWRAAVGLMKELEDLNFSSSPAPPYLVHGLKTLLHYLKQWNSPPSYSTGKEKEYIIKELGRHLKMADRILISLNPPKPERESTRPRKKRVLEDFVDYSPLIPKKKSLKNQRSDIEDCSNGKASYEKWDILNGGTKVVFRRLSRDQVGTLPKSHKNNKSLISFKGNDAEKYEAGNIIVISSDSEASDDWDILASNQLRSSNPVHSSHFGRIHFNAGCPPPTIAECDDKEKTIASKTEEIGAMEASDSQSEGHRGVVHQDDEYIYPSLLLSDDEVEGCKMPTKDNDTPWNPKAKVGIVAPRTDRPSRAGKQKLAVEKGLEAAASVVDAATLQRLKDFGKKTRDKSSGLRGFTADTDDSSRGLRGFVNNNPSPARQISRPPIKGRKNTTVKQRLSKILKLHRRQKN